MIRHHQPRPASPTRVVVLGASGFLGSDLMAYLREQRIPALGCSTPEVDLLQPRSIDWLQRTLHSDDVLVVTSAITPDKGKGNDVRCLIRNLTMGEHVAAFLEQSACGQVIYISSDAVYDDAANPVREDTPCDPRTLHGVMHLGRERMLAQASQTSRTPLLIVRPSPVYGPNDTHNGYGPNRFVRAAVRDRVIKLVGRGEEKRDHLYVRDLSRLIGMCIQYRSAGIINAATGHSVSHREVADTVLACCADARVECLPRATAIAHRHFDTSTTLRAFPMMRFTPLRVGLQSMLTAVSARAATTMPLAA